MQAVQVNTAGTWLARPPPTSLDLSDYAARNFKGQRPGTHARSWTGGYESGIWDVVAVTLANIHRFDHYGPLDEADYARLSTPMSMQSYSSDMPVGNADEVRAHFCKFLDHPMQHAWSASMLIIRHGLARPPIINLRQNAVNVTFLWCPIGRQMDSYAHQYDVHDVFCYDSVHFVACLMDCKLLNHRDELLTCPIKLFVVPVASQEVTVGLLWYLQIKRGDQRLRAKQAQDDGWAVQGQRLIRPPSGRVMWEDEETGQMTWEHPFLTRRLSYETKTWDWVDAKNEIHYQEYNAM
ncbi:hypothetical protein LTR27_002137 [Elasticomyces elasticus]|nr:hypothetical protein LTR27_002137 [Elasticomyces elasticus]